MNVMRTAVRLCLAVAVTAGVTVSGSLTATAAPAGRTLSYRTVVLGTLGGSSSVPTGLNDRGAVVGWANTADGGLHPFLWWHGRMTDLGTLDRTGGGWGIAEDVNRSGTVVGQSRLGEVSHAVRWQGGKVTDLGTLGGSYSSATAINDHGVIVGNSTTPDGVLHAFLWRDGRMTDLGVPGGGDVIAEDVNNRGQVVGFVMPTDRPAFGYLWQRGRVTVLPSTRYGGHARAINDAGLIVGSVSQAESNLAVAWRHGSYRLLGTLPGGDASGARDVNDRAVVLGTGNVQPHRLDEHAFLWRRGVFSDLSTAGVPESVVALNNRCEIIGTLPSADGEGAVAALFVPVG
jgi:probable HAF family extracellular repeat protein